ncbi:MAG: hypothetical protein DMG80_12775 [Acidobacteria bacterium]|nr:MAG: hypothetical protein DMG80_12775 [Acidobacteriota bacterium]
MMPRFILTLAILLGTSLASAAQTASAMLDATRAFLATLDAAQKSKAVLPFNSEERFRWFYTPVSRKGLPLKEMNPAQQRAALALLHAGLSEKGYSKAETIRKLEDVLRELEQGKGPTRDPELYFFTFFGEPDAKGAWGWRYEGHHCSQNWTIVNGQSIGSSPQFFGANPAEVREGPMKGTRVLSAEEDLGRSLVKSLTDAQKKDAVINVAAPDDILTNNQRKAAIQEDKGIAYSRLSKEQQGMLMALIEEHLSAQPQAQARKRLDKLRHVGFDPIKFAWMGGLEKGDRHYYRVQGSTFLIEYDNTQNNANHIHCVWRDFNGDWGEDILAEHYRNSSHHQHASAH